MPNDTVHIDVKIHRNEEEIKLTIYNLEFHNEHTLVLEEEEKNKIFEKCVILQQEQKKAMEAKQEIKLNEYLNTFSQNSQTKAANG